MAGAGDGFDVEHLSFMKKPRIQFRKTKAGGQKGAWRFYVFGANGEPLATSEGYTSRRKAVFGMMALKRALNWY